MRRWMGDGAWLLGGAAVNGLAAYAYLALGTRHYGATDFSGVSVLWSIWAVTGAAVVFPIQHEVTRRLESGRGEAPVRDIVVPLVATVLVLSLLVTAVAWALAEPLFGSDRIVNPLMAGWIVAGAGLSGLVRGALGGRRRFVATGMAIAAENLARRRRSSGRSRCGLERRRLHAGARSRPVGDAGMGGLVAVQRDRSFAG